MVAFHPFSLIDYIFIRLCSRANCWFLCQIICTENFNTNLQIHIVYSMYIYISIDIYVSICVYLYVYASFVTTIQ